MLFSEEVFGSLDWSRRDLAALNIQRARDHGIPGYNEVRRAYGLPPLNSWEDIIKELHEVPDDKFKDDLNNVGHHIFEFRSGILKNCFL